MADGPNDLSIETALRNREFEIQLFWQRANYFLVLITALGVGVFSVDKPVLGLIMSTFAAITCWLWFRTNLGSRFWQVFWEDEVERLAVDHNLESFLLTTEEIQRRMENSRHAKHKKGVLLRGWIDQLVIKKPSVTYHMILLSFFALVFWVMILIYFLWLAALLPLLKCIGWVS